MLQLLNVRGLPATRALCSSAQRRGAAIITAGRRRGLGTVHNERLYFVQQLQDAANAAVLEAAYACVVEYQCSDLPSINYKPVMVDVAYTVEKKTRKELEASKSVMRELKANT